MFSDLKKTLLQRAYQTTTHASETETGLNLLTGEPWFEPTLSFKLNQCSHWFPSEGNDAV